MMKTERFERQYQSFATKTDQMLREKLTQPKQHPLIQEIMRYCVFAGGKRLRAVLLLAANALYREPSETAFHFAAAIEMIHTYSLIHDDLPAMDDDDLRRGQTTAHKKFGEANAILAGDALLNLAYEVMNESAISQTEYVDMQNTLYASREIAVAAGVNGMIAGQAEDLINESNPQNSERVLLYIHQHKTGALIHASCLAGAYLAGASSEDKAALSKYAEELGLAFQITDDILDVTGDSKEVGKSIGKDDRDNKLTFVSYYGLERSKELAKNAIELAVQALSGFGDAADLLREIALSIPNRQK